MSFSKLNRTTACRKSMIMNMCLSLIRYERIKTTVAKAKTLRPVIEKLITKARNKKNGALLYSKLNNNGDAVKELVAIAERSKDRPGGYTRILKIGYRPGDNAPVAFIELVDR